MPADAFERLFERPPVEVSVNSEGPLLASALGATLYVPAHRPSLGRDIIAQRRAGVVSMVIDLEDSVPHDVVDPSVERVRDALLEVEARSTERPLLFLRPRSPEHLADVVDRLAEAAGLLAGYALPKFHPTASGPAWFDALAGIESELDRPVWALPIIEHPDFVHAERRADRLLETRNLLEEHRDRVLAVRIGATDMSGWLGLRRDRDTTIYEIRPVSDVIGDVVNVLGRPPHFTLSGPVWEHFAPRDRVLRTLLRSSPFIEHDQAALRAQIMHEDLDGLIREVVLDKANGLLGKSVIHPSHVPVVHALLAVTHEEYTDAGAVAGRGIHGGADRSEYRNKMNEMGPHARWADRVLARAGAFGVLRPGLSFVDVLSEGRAAG